AREIDPGIDVRGVGRADENAVRGVGRPARHVGGPEIRRIELGAGNLGNAIDAAPPGGSRIPAAAPGQRFARCEDRLLRGCQTRQAERDTARGDELHELAARRPHAASAYSILFRGSKRLAWCRPYVSEGGWCDCTAGEMFN